MSKHDLFENSKRVNRWRLHSKDGVYFSVIPDAPVGFMVTGVVFYHRKKDFYLRRDNSYQCIINLVVEGTGSFTSEESRVELRPGVVHWFCPGMWHEVKNRDEMKVYTIGIGRGDESRNLFRSHLGSLCSACDVNNAPLVQQLFMQALAVAKNGGSKAQEICMHLLKSILLLVQQGRTDAGAPNRKAMQTLLRARTIMDRNFGSGIRVKDVAQRCGVTYEHLSRLFRRFAEDTPSQYITRLRMNQAADLLRDSDMSVQKVAWEVGYEDGVAFAKAFKRNMGLSPGRFRKARGGR